MIPEVMILDIREQIVQKVMQTLKGRIDAETADMIQDVLVIELNEYEIRERCTSRKWQQCI